MSKQITVTLANAEAEAFMDEGISDGPDVEMSDHLARAHKKIRAAIIAAEARPDDADQLCSCGAPVDICKRYPCEED